MPKVAIDDFASEHRSFLLEQKEPAFDELAPSERDERKINHNPFAELVILSPKTPSTEQHRKG